MKKFAALGVTVGIALAAFGATVPAHAATVTSVTVSPTTLRSGDAFTFTVNGTSAPDASTDTFTGCYVYWVDGNPVQNQMPGGSLALPTNPFLWTNFTGVDSTLRYAGWAGATCGVGDTVPAGDPTWDTGVLTITPQVVIDPITIEVGKAITAPSFPYTYEPTGGTSPFDWTTGGNWTETSPSACAMAPARGLSALPSGVTLDENLSAAGTAANLILAGTPTTVGTYDVCMQLNGETDGQATAWMTVNVVEPELPKTGVDAMQATFLAGGAAVLAIAGVVLLLVRRRKNV